MHRKILNVNLETVCAIIRLKSKNNTPWVSFIQSSFLQEIARYNFIIIAIINISIIIIIIVYYQHQHQHQYHHHCHFAAGLILGEALSGGGGGGEGGLLFEELLS